ncbi:MAG: exodeoxyribonuclease III [Mariprofundales bacterium]
MLVTSWNVNSLRVRLPQVLEYLQHHKPDVLALQETKLQDQDFPCQEIADAGYHVVFAGQASYNGIAILSRLPIEDMVVGMPSYIDDKQQRLLTVTIANTRLINAYVPNGNSIGSEKYNYKMRWIAAWNEFIIAQDMGTPLIIVGDFNIAPANIDVHNRQDWHEKIMCSTEERVLFASMLELRNGMVDVIRQCNSKPCFSWWDYRSQAYKHDWGLRIDHILASNNLVCSGAGVHTYMREQERPSDHCPVWANIITLENNLCFPIR